MKLSGGLFTKSYNQDWEEIGLNESIICWFSALPLIRKSNWSTKSLLTSYRSSTHTQEISAMDNNLPSSSSPVNNTCEPLGNLIVQLDSFILT